MLAGGEGRRLGGAKPTASLRGRPLVAWPLAVLREVLDEVVVVAKRDTVLPARIGAPVWIEPDEPRHPVAGLLHALAAAGGRAVLVCAGDLPCVTAATVRGLAHGDVEETVLARGPDGTVQPLLGRYDGGGDTAMMLARALPAGRLLDAALALGPAFVAVDDRELLNVNTPRDLARAAALLGEEPGAP